MRIFVVKIVIPMSIKPVIGTILGRVAWTGLKVVTHFLGTVS